MIPPILSRLVVFVVAVAVFVQYRLSSTGVSPVATVLPPLPIFPTNDGVLTGKVEIIGKDDLVGPESLISTKHSGKEYMFASLGDGRVVRLNSEDGSSLTWTSLVRTGHQVSVDDPDGICGKGGPSDTTNTEQKCGRPLGMKIVKRSTVDAEHTGKDSDEDVLVIVDAYSGLLMVRGIYGPNEQAKVKTLATRANADEGGYKFHLLNGIIQTADGASLYITETSRYFQRRRIFHAVFDGKPTGRLLKYTKGEGVEVVADKLYMPNGLALSHDGKHLLVVAGVQILRYSLESNKMETEPFVNVMPGTGDNIDAFDHLPSGKKRKCYLAGFGSKYAEPFTLLKALSEKPLLKSILCALVPYKTIVNLIPKLSALAVYGEDGELIDVYQDFNATAPWLSEAEPMGEHLYLGSWFNAFLARVKMSDLK